MKKLLLILPMVFLFCFTFGCQKAEEEAKEGLTEEEVNAMMVEVVKVWNNADMEACNRVFSADYVDHDPASGDTIGLDAFKERIRAMHENVSSIDLSIHETFIKGNKVAVLGNWKITHISGADIELPGVNIIRIEDGKIVESTYYYDTKKELEQLCYKILPPEKQEKK